MSLLTKSRTTAASLPKNDPLRITLEVLDAGKHIGRAHSIPLKALIIKINELLPKPLTENQWQTQVLKKTRTVSCFIGSGPKGFFIIDTIDDARAMKTFYETRIASEQRHLKNLSDQVKLECKWIL
jgi:hypothetical protein